MNPSYPFFLLVLFMLCLVPQSHASIVAKGYLHATESCQAPKRIRRDNPGNVKLITGQIYATVERNKPDGDFIRIRVPGAQPELRWVPLNCGDWKQYPCAPQVLESGVVPVEPDTPADATFLPFFDDQHNPVRVNFPRNTMRDITPPVPEISPLGEKLLEICGGLGADISREAFRSVLQNPESAPLIERIRNEVGCDLFGQCDDSAIIEGLVDIWFNSAGFKHVFCGEPSSRNMSGLHYHGRYLQMQENGWGGALDPAKGKEEIVEGLIYSLGTVHLWNNKRVETKIKGYPYVLSAADLLLHGTQAYSQVNPTSNAKRACLYHVPATDDSPSFKAVFVAKEKGLRTFYPDATPGNNPSCSGPP